MSVQRIEPHPLDGLLEPGARNYDHMVSMAISLKRIADAITNRDQYENPITQAIQNGINQGALDWIGHMARNR